MPLSWKQTLSNKIEREANDRLAEKYFHIWDTYPIQRLSHEIESGWLTQEVRPGSRVLLAGSGGGREIDALRTAREIVALDISPEMLKVGQQRYPDPRISWRLGDIEAMDRDLTGFDAVIAIGGVLIYLRHPREALRAMHAALNPSGTLILSVMNRCHPTESYKNDERSGGRYRHPFTVEEIVDLVSEVGFHDIRVKGYRYFIDLLPREWNSDRPPSDEVRQVIDKLAEAERLLVHCGSAKNAKILWITATRP